VRLVLAAVIGVVGCGGPRSSVTASAPTPPYPTDFTPPPALGPPPPDDPTARGHAYLELVYDGIKEPWTSFLEECRLRLPPTDPLNKPALEARAAIEIDAHGGIIDLHLTSSGNEDFDAAVRSIATDRAPYPEPPADLLSDDGHAHLEWRFARDVRQAGLAGAEVVVIQWPADRAVPKLLAEHHLEEAARRLLREPADAGGRLELAEQVFSAAIEEGLGATEVAARRLAIETTTRTPIPSVVAQLRGRARSAVDATVRAGTFTALALLADAETVPLAMEALDEGPIAGPIALASAAGALEKLGAGDRARPIVAAWLRNAARGDGSALTASLAALAVLPAGDQLQAVIDGVAKKDARVRASACAVYGRAAAAGDAAAWPALVAGLKDGDASVRAACATAAGVAGAAGKRDKKTVGVLVGRLADRDLTAKAAAIAALARLDRARATTELKKLASAGETDATVLVAMADAWSRLAKPPVDKLRKLAGHADPGVRAAAIEALVRVGGSKELDEAALHAGDAAEVVRLAALRAVRAEAVLREMTRDTSPAVRAAADERLVAVLGRAATVDERLVAVAEADPASHERVRIAASWLLAR
jgi:hypothetical protein